MDNQIVQLGSAAVIGFIFGRAQASLRSILHASIVVGAAYILYTYG